MFNTNPNGHEQGHMINEHYDIPGFSNQTEIIEVDGKRYLVLKEVDWNEAEDEDVAMN